ncbi:uncharacterized protein LOC126376448 isoform X4 [Pectinophora gossypiella]|uniref:uncharacterized protein LOC126376448 isoform X4 n=1 Tax=Pectinophora gossypiella TaxID=13191 RepID=UPI00214E3293|nr:uncharacterized protein LOC126376448 isoform X4 [Pectinophora gossypiella]
MKCFVLVVLCLAYAYGGAIRCPPGTEDISCTAEQEVTTESPTETEALYRRVCKEATGPIVEKCRRYFCTEAGVVAFRTIPNCEPNMTEVRQNCTPGSHFTQDCNMCICLENQLGLCTVKNCGRATIPKKSELVSGKECAAGSSWKSRCNDCGCTPDGYAFCTEKACLDQQEDTVMRCAPDTMWNNECNTCWCTTDGRAMCTRMGCASDQQPEGATGTKALTDVVPRFPNAHDTEELKAHYSKESLENLDKGKAYSKETIYGAVNPQHEIRDHSFEELGNEYIKPDHSLEDVNPIEENDNILEESNRVKDKHNVLKRSVCKPNQVFQSECNTCKCAPDGQSYTCTQNECMEGEKNKEVEVFMESEGEDHVEKHSVCKPRGTFYIGCNTCHCNLYGSDYSCTNKPCPLPEDVELFHELKDMKPIIPLTEEKVANRNSSQKTEDDFKL